ncbi:MAG: 50S ribosomal protein L1 [Simkaniaceae bacterium]
MTKISKRFKEIAQLVNCDKTYKLDEAIEVLLSCPNLKFDESVEIALKTGADPKKADQQVRGTVSLPHGTGREVKLLIFAKGDKLKEALDAGADFVGDEETIEKIKGGWFGFNAVLATPDMMREVGKLGKILGPRGLMPTPKAGTVTPNVGQATKEIKAGKVEYKLDKNACINNLVGKKSFSKEQLIENIQTFMGAINRAKPMSAKGQYLQGLSLALTMGPGVKIDIQSVIS